MREHSKKLAELWRGGRLHHTEQCHSRWWDAVREMASFVASGCSEMELTETPVRHRLLAKGYIEEEVTRAVEWVEKTTVSGTLMASLSMLQSHSVNPRIGNIVEKSYFSEKIWQALEAARAKAFISHDLYEKLIESIRGIDTRGWDDRDVLLILSQMYAGSVPNARPEDFLHIVSGVNPTEYC